jgi:hypothetical protein
VAKAAIKQTILWALGHAPEKKTLDLVKVKARLKKVLRCWAIRAVLQALEDRRVEAVLYASSARSWGIRPTIVHLDAGRRRSWWKMSKFQTI